MSQPPEYSEEELRALEAEMERVTIDDVLLQTIMSLISLTARRAGLASRAGGTEPGPEPDWEQVRTGIEACRAILPIVEPRHAAHLGPIRDGLSQLQVVYAQQSGAQPADRAPGEPAAPADPQAPAQPQPGDARSSGRLWIPGQ